MTAVTHHLGLTPVTEDERRDTGTGFVSAQDLGNLSVRNGSQVADVTTFRNQMCSVFTQIYSIIDGGRSFDCVRDIGRKISTQRV
jgi:hypothetical protein